MHPWDEFLLYLPTYMKTYKNLRHHMDPQIYHALVPWGGILWAWGPNLRDVFCFLFGFYREGVEAKLAKKKRNNRKYIFIHLHPSSSIFMHGIHASFYQAAMLDLPGCISCCIPLKFGGLFLYFPLDPKTPRHPQFGYIGQYPAFRLGVLECPLRHVLLDTYTPLVN